MNKVLSLVLIMVTLNVIADPAEYISGQGTKNEAAAYVQTKELSIRYLAYRDLNPWFAKLKDKKTLDYGSGLGLSVDYLLKQGFEVQAVDTNAEMIEIGKAAYPEVDFTLVTENDLPFADKSFDLIFSSYVLFEMNNLENMTIYLKNAARVLKDDGYVIAIVASQDIYNPEYKSNLYETNFLENYKQHSGSLVKMRYKEIDMAFIDYLWLEQDYRQAFANAGLKVCAVHYPLGKEGENYPWLDELHKSPLLLILASKQ